MVLLRVTGEPNRRFGRKRDIFMRPGFYRISAMRAGWGNPGKGRYSCQRRSGPGSVPAGRFPGRLAGQLHWFGSLADSWPHPDRLAGPAGLRCCVLRTPAGHAHRSAARPLRPAPFRPAPFRPAPRRSAPRPVAPRRSAARTLRGAHAPRRWRSRTGLPSRLGSGRRARAGYRRPAGGRYGHRTGRHSCVNLRPRNGCRRYFGRLCGICGRCWRQPSVPCCRAVPS